MGKLLDIAKKVLEQESREILRVRDRLDADFDKIIHVIQHCTGRVVFTGMGKSGLIGKKISSTMASTGTPSIFMHPAEAFHGDLGMIRPEDVIMAISNSGETEEIIRLLPFFKDNKNKIIAMTGGGLKSTLGKYSDFLIDLSVTEEACPMNLAPTTSTTVTLAVGDALAICLMKENNFQAEHFARFHPGGKLGKKLLTKVKDIMKCEKLPVISPEMKFDEIVLAMSNGRLGLAILSNDQKRILGIITDGDLRRTMQKEGGRCIELKAREICTKNPVTINENTIISKVEEILIQKKITSILVTNDLDELVGVIEIYDI